MRFMTVRPRLPYGVIRKPTTDIIAATEETNDRKAKAAILLQHNRREYMDKLAREIREVKDNDEKGRGAAVHSPENDQGHDQSEIDRKDYD